MDKAAEHNPDVVIAGHQMVGMADLDFIRRLRELPCADQTSVIVISGRDFQLSPETIDSLGVQAVFSKPFSPRELLETVNFSVDANRPDQLCAVGAEQVCAVAESFTLDQAETADAFDVL